MKIIRILIVMLVFAFSLNAQTTTKIVSVNLNLRADASTNSAVITVIPKGTLITTDKECSCEWIPVRYQGKVGYVSTKYLVNYNSNGSITNNAGNFGTPVKYYTNSAGQKVQSPTKYNSIPAGATALCRDGTYSFSRNRRGTCSHHGGVARWL